MKRLREARDLRLRDIEVFVEVERAKSVREAARRLETTPGQISKSVRHLEVLLGTRLFKRSTAGLLLTSAGDDFTRLAQDLLMSGQMIEQVLFGENNEK